MLGDWSFRQAALIESPNDHPTGGSDPCVRITGSSDCYPTAGTVNGSSVLGINYGTLETWFKFTAYGVGNSLMLCFRINDTAHNSSYGFKDEYCAYVAFSSSSSSTYYIRRISGGAATGFVSSGATSRPVLKNVWQKMRVRWFESSGSLAIIYEIDFQDGNGYVQQGSTVIDSTNAYVSGTNTIGLFLILGSGGTMSLDNTVIQTA